MWKCERNAGPTGQKEDLNIYRLLVAMNVFQKFSKVISKLLELLLVMTIVLLQKEFYNLILDPSALFSKKHLEAERYSCL